MVSRPAAKLTTPAPQLVLDWDGTITTFDTLEAVIAEFGDLDLWRSTGRLRGDGLSNDEAIALSFTSVRASLAVVVAWLVPRVRIRPGFAELVSRYHPLIVSSGFRELIEPVLVQLGLRPGRDLGLVANRIEAGSDGWRTRIRDERTCPACGETCKRRDVPPESAVFVGDGYSDRCAALTAEHVFARGKLAAYLAEKGVAFERFDDFHDVLRALAAQPAA